MWNPGQSLRLPTYKLTSKKRKFTLAKLKKTRPTQTSTLIFHTKMITNMKMLLMLVTWCSWVLLEHRVLARSCVEPGSTGTDYTGILNVTWNGVTCQTWAAQTPHKHQQTHFATDGSITKARNYCRNPNNTTGPWCYTTDPDDDWEYCDVPICNDCIEVTGIGSDYTGTVNTTTNGKACQAWASQTPHTQKQINFMTDGSIEDAKNYCRNPDNSGSRPWCYTMDASDRWQYCDVPYCRHSCMEVYSKGTEYTGRVSVTMSGLTCQVWSSQIPHAHTMIHFATDGNIKNARNYCRNPDGDERPWCYTTNPQIRWQFCNIPYCKHDCLLTTMGIEYTGTVSVTASGLTCQEWTSQFPHAHCETNFATDGGITSAKNYCRNPNKNVRPWCYTTDPNTRWQYCNITLCYA